MEIYILRLPYCVVFLQRHYAGKWLVSGKQLQTSSKNVGQCKQKRYFAGVMLSTDMFRILWDHISYIFT